jgi:uncharacterized protein (DUF2267 family)
MSATGLDVFDTTVQESNSWLKIVMEELGTDDRHVAFGALRATLHALRDRMGVMNAIHFAAQLPMLLRGAYYEGWRPAGDGAQYPDSFFQHVAAGLPVQWDLDPVAAAQASLEAIVKRMDAGEVEKLCRLLPRDLSVVSSQRSEAAPLL